MRPPEPSPWWQRWWVYALLFGGLGAAQPALEAISHDADPVKDYACYSSDGAYGCLPAAKATKVPAISEIPKGCRIRNFQGREVDARWIVRSQISPDVDEMSRLGIWMACEGATGADVDHILLPTKAPTPIRRTCLVTLDDGSEIDLQGTTEPPKGMGLLVYWGYAMECE